MKKLSIAVTKTWVLARMVDIPAPQYITDRCQIKRSTKNMNPATAANFNNRGDNDKREPRINKTANSARAPNKVRQNPIAVGPSRLSPTSLTNTGAKLIQTAPRMSNIRGLNRVGRVSLSIPQG